MEPSADGERQRWNERHAASGGAARPPSAFLLKYSRILPVQGAALDIACGTGENAIFLAKELHVTAIDVSDVAIGIARQKVDKAGLGDRVRLVSQDAASFLNAESPGKYVLVTCINYFDPAIVPGMKRVLAPGGTIAIQAFTTRDERLQCSPHVRDKLVTEAMLFEPAMLGGYWILVSELDDFIDDEGNKRQRVNVIARKPH
ncbi:MAG: class I SAM-dependent methyltransferase [Candidatus Sigynarchaeum springense]